MSIEQYVRFIEESNTIEGINREPTDAEINEFVRFINLENIEIKDLKKFVSIYAPGNILRSKPNLNVIIGGCYAPSGGKQIRNRLQCILDNMDTYCGSFKPLDYSYTTPYETHIKFELLHPFTDGNGRSGRALWAWQMIRLYKGNFPKLSFLHSFYYQTLANEKKND